VATGLHQRTVRVTVFCCALLAPTAVCQSVGIFRYQKLLKPLYFVLSPCYFIFITVRQLPVYGNEASPFDEVCRLQLPLVLASAVILGSESRGTHDCILLFQIRHFSKLENQVPVFMSLRNAVAQLYSQALCSIFVAFYDSQGYGGAIRTHLHTCYCLKTGFLLNM
jgi:hypothetical protein